MNLGRVLSGLLLFSAAGLLHFGCPPPPPPPSPSNECSGISVPAIQGPASGSQAICPLPSDCREDSVAVPLDNLLCNDKTGGYCNAGAGGCSGSSHCQGTVISSGVKVTPNSCPRDRNSECKTAAGAAGSYCTCSWPLPAGSSLACGCGCR